MSAWDWSKSEDKILLMIIEGTTESRITFELVAQTLNIIGEYGEKHPFRTWKACEYRLKTLRRKAANENNLKSSIS